MGSTLSPETSAFKLQTPGKFPEEYKLPPEYMSRAIPLHHNAMISKINEFGMLLEPLRNNLSNAINLSRYSDSSNNPELQLEGRPVFVSSMVKAQR